MREDHVCCCEFENRRRLEKTTSLLLLGLVGGVEWFLVCLTKGFGSAFLAQSDHSTARRPDHRSAEGRQGALELQRTRATAYDRTRRSGTTALSGSCALTAF